MTQPRDRAPFSAEVDRPPLRLPGGARTLARVPAHDRATLAVLMDEERTPVGRDGRVRREPDGLLAWSAA